MKCHLMALLLCASSAAADPAQVEAVNALRQAEGRAALEYSDLLAEAAMRHARDLAAAQHFSHLGSNGSDVAERVSAVGYGWCVVAENIAKGHETLAEVLSAWNASPGHRKNMLSPEMRAFAVARAEGNIWVMVLAAPGC